MDDPATAEAEDQSCEGTDYYGDEGARVRVIGVGTVGARVEEGLGHLEGVDVLNMR